MRQFRTWAALVLAVVMGLGVWAALGLALVVHTAGATTHEFDTEFIPGQHSVLLSFSCDDKVDSQYVNIGLEYGVSITFSPYSNSVTDINGDFDGNPYYDEWLIGWAKNKGMDFGIHAQPSAVSALAAGGRDSVIAVWDENVQFVRQWGGFNGPKPGFIWVGHRNSPELRAMAKEYGFPWTRGNAGATNADLYLNGGGWNDAAEGTGFFPPIMYHKAVVPSCGMYRLNTSGSSFSHVSTAADTTGWWVGVHAFLDTLNSKNGVAFLNIHPGWTGTNRETISKDSTFARDLVVPNGNKIILRGRQGNTGRNDISALQLSYILEAMAHWDSLKVDTEGSKRLCIMSMKDIMSDPNIPWRTDDTDNPDVALANTFSAADSLADPYFQYDGDPTLIPKESFKVYVDGTGTVKAGTGTRQYPLPFGAINHLFNCTVEFVGHEPGDTKSMPAKDMRCGNVIFDLNGLVLQPVDTTAIWVKYFDTGTKKYYLTNITWKNGGIDFNSNASVWGWSIGDIGGTTASKILRPRDITFKGITFGAAKQALWLQNVRSCVIDSCFFSAPSGINSVYQINGGYELERPIIRNSVFDLTGAGTSSWAFDFGSASTVNWEDSLAIVNNVFITGTSTHYILRTPTHANLDTTGVGSNVRFSGNYIVSNKASAATTLVNGYGGITVDAWTGIIDRNSPGFYDHKNYVVGAWTGFNALTESSDTLRFGGSTSWASVQNNNHASIGPLLFNQPPTIAIGAQAMQRVPAYARKSFWQMVDLVNDGVLDPCDPLDPDTYIPVSAPALSDPAGQGAMDLLHTEWKAWYDANAADRGDIILKY